MSNGDEGRKIDRAMALIEQGRTRLEVATMLGYPSVQHLNSLVWYWRNQNAWRAKCAINPELDPKRRNVERVRQYIEANVGCLKKQIMIDLNLAQHTVDRALRIIREEAESAEGQGT